MSNIVSNATLCNWQHNRAIPDLSALFGIAKYLNISFFFITCGVYEDFTNEVKGAPIHPSEYHAFCEYKKNQASLMTFDHLYDPDKKIVENLITRLARLRRHIDGIDYNPGDSENIQLDINEDYDF